MRGTLLEPLMRLSPALSGLLAALSLAGCGTEKGPVTPSEIDLQWAAYDIQPPPAEISAMLNAQPFIYPDTACVPADTVSALPEGTALVTDGDGQEWLCVQEMFNGNAPEGMKYNEVASCEAPFTQGPPWFTQPGRVYVSDDALLEDTAFVAELDWVQSQVESSGCGCCHASTIGSGHTSGFDMGAPGVWTDSLTNAQLLMGAGRFEEHLLFGRFDPADNHGFDRSQTLFASTDPARMRAFFEAEFARRNGTDADVEAAQRQFDALFGNLSDVPAACVAPYEGLLDGRLTWNGDDTVRQIYIAAEDSPTPAFPPDLNIPAGTVWALYIDNDGAPVASGSLAIGDVPEKSRQIVPADGSPPALVDGQTYRLIATEDIMLSRPLDCTFVYEAPVN